MRSIRWVVEKNDGLDNYKLRVKTSLDITEISNIVQKWYLDLVVIWDADQKALILNEL